MQGTSVRDVAADGSFSLAPPSNLVKGFPNKAPPRTSRFGTSPFAHHSTRAAYNQNKHEARPRLTPPPSKASSSDSAKSGPKVPGLKTLPENRGGGTPAIGLTAAPSRLDPEPFRHALASWYRKHARALPWRGIRNPYATWLSEIMLQQTRVATVLDRYTLFLERFPTVAALAAAPEDDVLALWSGLGYYRRARMLHRGAQFVVRELAGELPRSASVLRTLPGVGEYTAAAIASIAFGESIAVLDGNVERVLLRLIGLPESKSANTRALLLATANTLVPPAASPRSRANPPGDHNQAMMELGATICLPRAPLCLQCPVLAFCRTRGEHTTSTRKPLLSRPIACLLATRKHGTRTEVLLVRRAINASLMPGMLELPPLPLDAVVNREPILRLRHSITDTNYYVEVFAEPATGAPPPSQQELDANTDNPPLPFTSETLIEDNDNEDAVYIAPQNEVGRGTSLQREIPASEADLRWLPTLRLPDQPLTGLTRKVLQRLGLMRMPAVRVGPGKSV